MSGGRKRRPPPKSTSDAPNQDRSRYDDDVDFQQDMQQLSTTLQTTSVREPRLLAPAPPPSLPLVQPQGRRSNQPYGYPSTQQLGPPQKPPPYPPQGYQSYQTREHPSTQLQRPPQVPPSYPPQGYSSYQPHPSYQAEGPPPAPLLLDTAAQLESHRATHEAVAAAKSAASGAANRLSQPNARGQQAQAACTSVSTEFLAGSAIPRNPPWTDEQDGRLRRYKEAAGERARWAKVAEDVGGGHNGADCERRWMMITRAVDNSREIRRPPKRERDADAQDKAGRQHKRRPWEE